MEYTKKGVNRDWSMDFELEDDEENPFDSISESGRDFVSSLIKSKSNERLTADEALSHPWLQNVSRISNYVPDKVDLDQKRTRN